LAAGFELEMPEAQGIAREGQVDEGELVVLHAGYFRRNYLTLCARRATVPPGPLYCQRMACQYLSDATPSDGWGPLSAAGESAAPAVPPRPRTPPMREVLASPKMLAILVLGAASGYPNQLTESALQAWLKDAGATNTTIGLMSYVAIPYLLKFLWAPFVDRYPIPILGRRRGWMLITQVALALALVLLAGQNPSVTLTPITACAIFIVFCSATQDIV